MSSTDLAPSASDTSCCGGGDDVDEGGGSSGALDSGFHQSLSSMLLALHWWSPSQLTFSTALLAMDCILVVVVKR